MGRRRKPLVDIDVKCKHCNAVMAVKVYRRRIGDRPLPPDYDYDQEIQLKLPGLQLVCEAVKEAGATA